MTHKVTAPVADFDGTVAGFKFADGVAEVDNPNAIAYFKRHGYAVEDIKPATTDPRPVPKKAPAKKAAPKPSDKK